MTSGSIFSGTLQTITNTKLNELSKQHSSFKKHHDNLLSTASVESDPLRRLNTVVDGTKLCLGVKTTVRKDEGARPGRVIIGGTQNEQLELDLVNVDRFLDQARFDPSVSSDVLRDWEEKFVRYVSIQASKYEYAELYGKLVTEWLSSEKTATAGSEADMGDSFEELPSAKKMEARKIWEKSAFDPASVNVPALNNYLQSLFGANKKNTGSALSRIRTQIENFEDSLTHSSQFDPNTLRWVIKSLRNSDLLSNEKREVLGDFLSNDVILSEIADVLNMRLEALDRWSWGDYVHLEQRRQINGQYQVHMQEDVLQGIFLHYIGVRWSVCFKAAFLALRNDSKTWKSNRADMPKADAMRRAFFLGDQSTQHGCLDDKRSDIQRDRYFTSQLLTREEQQIEHNDGEEEADYAEFVHERSSGNRATQDWTFPAAWNQQPQATGFSAAPAASHVPPQQGGLFGGGGVAKPAFSSQGSRVHTLIREMETELDGAIPNVTASKPSLFGAPPAQQNSGGGLFGNIGQKRGGPDDNDAGFSINPMEARQSLLHILASEVMLNTRFNGEIACFRTTFESWNPLLPHDTILTVLEFFGVSTKWRNFFKAFLEAPLKFADDHPSTEPRFRRRGTPGAHALSDVFGEMVLFCLDFSVNQNTNGALLHRLHDDLWFWNKDYEICAMSWASVQEFAQITGTQIDTVKSGSIRIGKDGKKEIDERLPRGDIRWGFLYLNPSNGRFDIDQKMVDSHVKELRQQLQGKSKSVIDWIQTWNSYAGTFFSTNFGKAANCFGREHIDTMLATHRHIQESVFDGGNVVKHLKQMIEDRFGVTDLPDGFLYFPVELGGLDLKSPFVELLQIRDSFQDPHSLLEEYEENEQADYLEAKRRFDNSEIARKQPFGQPQPPPVQPRSNVFGGQPTSTPFSQPAASLFGGQPTASPFGGQPASSPFGGQPASGLFGQPTIHTSSTTTSNGQSDMSFGQSAPQPNASEFFSFEEFTRYRESISARGNANLYNVFIQLRRRPVAEPVDGSTQVLQALAKLRHSNQRGITSNWYSMTAYWKWIAQMYGPNMITRFGGFNVVDSGWLPIGMVSQFRQRRTKWQG